jgi:peptidoglycan hydrolase CwlO-like protein
MDNLPTTLQEMKDYVRFAKSTIKREETRIKDLQEAIFVLEPKIKDIEEQIK